MVGLIDRTLHRSLDCFAYAIGVASGYGFCLVAEIVFNASSEAYFRSNALVYFSISLALATLGFLLLICAAVLAIHKHNVDKKAKVFLVNELTEIAGASAEMFNLLKSLDESENVYTLAKKLRKLPIIIGSTDIKEVMPECIISEIEHNSDTCEYFAMSFLILCESLNTPETEYIRLVSTIIQSILFLKRMYNSASITSNPHKNPPSKEGDFLFNTLIFDFFAKNIKIMLDFLCKV